MANTSGFDECAVSGQAHLQVLSGKLFVTSSGLCRWTICIRSTRNLRQKWLTTQILSKA